MGRPALTLIRIAGDNFRDEDLSLAVIAEQGAMPTEDLTLDAIQRVAAIAQRENSPPSVSARGETWNEVRAGAMELLASQEHSPERRVTGSVLTVANGDDPVNEQVARSNPHADLDVVTRTHVDGRIDREDHVSTIDSIRVAGRVRHPHAGAKIGDEPSSDSIQGAAAIDDQATGEVYRLVYHRLQIDDVHRCTRSEERVWRQRQRMESLRRVLCS